MIRKKNRPLDSDHALTWIFVWMLALAAIAGLLGQLGHSGMAQ